MQRTLTIALLAAALLAAPAAAQDGAWPQFRGPRASGLGAGRATPTRWDLASGEHVLWKRAIPGMAHASPIVWGERVYVTTAVGPGEAQLKVGLYGDVESADDQGRHQWRLLALDRRTGAVAFDVVAHEGPPRSKRHTKASHCNSTPATDGKRIVAILGSEGLFCFDLAGKLLWKRDLGPLDAGWYRSPAAQWGFGSSPVLHDGVVIVQCDVQQGSYLAAFDAASGKQLWRTPRDEVPTWCTPTIVRVGRQTQILVNGWRHTGAYDFASGALIWRHVGGGDIPVPTPIVAHGLAYFTSAHGRYRPISAIRLGARGDITPAELGQTSDAIRWAHARRGSYMQTPIVVGELLYDCLDNGVLTCFDALTGEVRYRERLAPRGGWTASPVSDGRHVYFTSERGEVVVVAAGAKHVVAATNQMVESCLATPAISDGTLIVRTRRGLVALRD